MDKEDVYTVEYYSAIKKNEILLFAAIWMDLEVIMLSEISQIKKDKYCMISLICGILKRQTHRNKEENDSCQGLVGGGQWGSGLDKTVSKISSILKSS